MVCPVLASVTDVVAYTHVYLLYNRSYINFKNNKHVAEKGGSNPLNPPLDPALYIHVYIVAKAYRAQWFLPTVAIHQKE